MDVSDYMDIPVSVIDFNDWEYCVRSEEAKAWGMAFEKYETDKKHIGDLQKRREIPALLMS
jgi:hypothetical protein